MNASESAYALALQLPDSTGPIALIGFGVILITAALVAALRSPDASGGTPLPAAVVTRRLDAWIFLAILVFALVLVVFGTSTTQLTGVGMLVVTVAAAWFRKGRSGESGPRRTDTGSFSADFRGIKYERRWTSEAPSQADDSSV